MLVLGGCRKRWSLVGRTCCAAVGTFHLVVVLHIEQLLLDQVLVLEVVLGFVQRLWTAVDLAPQRAHSERVLEVLKVVLPAAQHLGYLPVARVLSVLEVMPMALMLVALRPVVDAGCVLVRSVSTRQYHQLRSCLCRPLVVAV